MKAIVNATPLIALSLLDRLHLLPKLFAELFVPQAVYQEVVVKGAGKTGSEALLAAEWLQVITPDVTPTIDPLLLGLDAGEMEVLLLAQQLTPDWVIIDERLARSVAFALGMPVKGTLGILLAAVYAELLAKDAALSDLEKLVQQGIRVSPRWQEWFRKEVSSGLK
jgi:uncharacterized protein